MIVSPDCGRTRTVSRRSKECERGRKGIKGGKKRGTYVDLLQQNPLICFGFLQYYLLRLNLRLEGLCGGNEDESVSATLGEGRDGSEGRDGRKKGRRGGRTVILSRRGCWLMQASLAILADSVAW
jgi:hypothetical protein